MFEFSKVIKIIAGCDRETTSIMNEIYSTVIEAGTYEARDIKTAEAIKITENIQRDVNIALMNELSKLYQKLNINIHDVINGASTKWNFGKYQPGMVGGHCISVDPYYLIHKSKECKVNLDIVKAGRRVNEKYYKNFTDQIIKELLSTSGGGNKVLLLGAAYKETVADFRNTKVVDMYNELIKFDIDVTIVDDHVDKELFYKEYGINIKTLNEVENFNIVFIYQPHDIYIKLKAKDFKKLLVDSDSVIFDYKNVIDGEIRHMYKVI